MKRALVNAALGGIVGLLLPVLVALVLIVLIIQRSPLLPQRGGYAQPTPGYWSGAPTPTPTPIPPSGGQQASELMHQDAPLLLGIAPMGLMAGAVGGVVGARVRRKRSAGQPDTGSLQVGPALLGGVIASVLLWVGIFLLVVTAMMIGG